MTCQLELYKYTPLFLSDENHIGGIIKIARNIQEDRSLWIRINYNLTILIDSEPQVIPTDIYDSIIVGEIFSIIKITRLEMISIIKNALNKYNYISYFELMKIWLVSRLESLLEDEALERYKNKCVKKIYQSVYDAYLNPYTIIGKKRLLRDFDNLLKN